MKTKSFWAKDLLSGKHDVLIVGGGIVGLTTAICLKEKQKDLKISLLDKGVWQYAASTRNAGFACFGSISELSEDAKTLSETQLCDLINLRWQGLLKLRERVGDRSLKFKQLGAYEVFDLSNEDELFSCKQRINYFNEIVENATGLENTYSIRNTGLGMEFMKEKIYNKYEGELHPGYMMKTLREKALVLGVEIWDDIEVEKLEDDGNLVNLFLVNGQKIKTNKLVLCTNAFSNNLLPSKDLKPARNQVLMTKPIKNLAFVGCFHFDKGYVYFRNYENRLLIGGGRNHFAQEWTEKLENTEEVKQYLRRIVNEKILPGVKYEEDCWWSGIIAVGGNKTPRVEKHGKNVISAVKLGGMGVAIGSILGEQAAEAVFGSL